MEKLLIDKKQLAEICSISTRTIEKNVHRIAGKIKIGRIWRFNFQVIKERIAQGKSIFVDA